MPTVIGAQEKKGKKEWFIYSATGNKKHEKRYPAAGSKSEFYDMVSAEIGVPPNSVALALTAKSLRGSVLVDDS